MASTEKLRKYLHYMENPDLSEPQKIEYLQTLWSMMSAFVDLGFEANFVQQTSPPVRVNVDGDNNTDPARSGSP
jgi:hypothetical protein